MNIKIIYIILIIILHKYFQDQLKNNNIKIKYLVNTEMALGRLKKSQSNSLQETPTQKNVTQENIKQTNLSRQTTKSSLIVLSDTKGTKKNLNSALTTSNTKTNLKTDTKTKTNDRVKFTTDKDIIEPQQLWIKNEEDKILKETSLLEQATNILKIKVKNISIKPNTIHLIIKYVMELVEDTPIKGGEQKDFALKIMRELFKDLTEGEDELVLLKLLDEGTIGNMIDLIVDATNGKLNINTLIETSSSCITTCLPYCLSSKSKSKSKK